jgi:hypothetical protein
MNRMIKMCLLVLMVGMLVPAFALDEVRFARTLNAAAGAQEYVYCLMEPGMPKHSPDFQSALAMQKQTRLALANEINALDTVADLNQARALVKTFAKQSDAAASIAGFAESLIASRLAFVTAHAH